MPGKCYRRDPPQTFQRGVTSNTHLPIRRGGQVNQRGAAQEEGRLASEEGAYNDLREAGRLAQGGGGVEDPPPDAPHHGFFRDGGGTPPSTKEGADLQDFTPSREHLLLQEVYGDSPHHNDGTHLTGGVPDDAIWKMFWHRLAAQSASWYSTPPGKVGRRFTAVLAAE